MGLSQSCNADRVKELISVVNRIYAGQNVSARDLATLGATDRIGGAEPPQTLTQFIDELSESKKQMDATIRDLYPQLKALSGGRLKDVNVASAPIEELVSGIMSIVPSPSQSFPANDTTHRNVCNKLAEVLGKKFGVTSLDPSNVETFCADVVREFHARVLNHFVTFYTKLQRITESLMNIKGAATGAGALIAKLAAADDDNSVAIASIAKKLDKFVDGEVNTVMALIETQMSQSQRELMKSISDTKLNAPGGNAVAVSENLRKFFAAIAMVQPNYRLMAHLTESLMKALKQTAAEVDKLIKDSDYATFLAKIDSALVSPGGLDAKELDKLKKLRDSISVENFLALKSGGAVFDQAPDSAAVPGCFANMAGLNDVVGSAEVSELGDNVNERARKIIAENFRQAVGKAMSQLVPKIKTIGNMVAEAKIEYSDKIDDFISRFKELDIFGEVNFIYNVLGVRRDATSKSAQLRFVSTLNAFKQTCDTLSPVNGAFADCSTIASEVLKIREDFAAQMDRISGGNDEKHSAAAAHAIVQGGADTPVVGIPFAELSNTFNNLEDLFRVNRLKQHLKNSVLAQVDIKKKYYDDLNKVIKDLADRVNTEFATVYKHGSENLDGNLNDLVEKKKLSADELMNYSKADFRAVVDELRDGYTSALKVISEVEKLLLEYKDGVIENSSDVRELATALNSVKLTSEWLSKSTRENVFEYLESFSVGAKTDAEYDFVPGNKRKMFEGVPNEGKGGVDAKLYAGFVDAYTPDATLNRETDDYASISHDAADRTAANPVNQAPANLAIPVNYKTATNVVNSLRTVTNTVDTFKNIISLFINLGTKLNSTTDIRTKLSSTSKELFENLNKYLRACGLTHSFRHSTAHVLADLKDKLKGLYVSQADAATDEKKHKPIRDAFIDKMYDAMLATRADAYKSNAKFDEFMEYYQLIFAMYQSQHIVPIVVYIGNTKYISSTVSSGELRSVMIAMQESRHPIVTDRAPLDVVRFDGGPCGVQKNTQFTELYEIHYQMLTYMPIFDRTYDLGAGDTAHTVASQPMNTLIANPNAYDLRVNNGVKYYDSDTANVAQGLAHTSAVNATARVEINMNYGRYKEVANMIRTIQFINDYKAANPAAVYTTNDANIDISVLKASEIKDNKVSVAATPIVHNTNNFAVDISDGLIRTSLRASTDPAVTGSFGYTPSNKPCTIKIIPINNTPGAAAIAGISTYRMFSGPANETLHPSEVFDYTVNAGNPTHQRTVAINPVGRASDRIYMLPALIVASDEKQAIVAAAAAVGNAKELAIAGSGAAYNPTFLSGGALAGNLHPVMIISELENNSDEKNKKYISFNNNNKIVYAKVLLPYQKLSYFQDYYDDIVKNTHGSDTFAMNITDFARVNAINPTLATINAVETNFIANNRDYKSNIDVSPFVPNTRVAVGAPTVTYEPMDYTNNTKHILRQGPYLQQYMEVLAAIHKTIKNDISLLTAADRTKLLLDAQYRIEQDTTKFCIYNLFGLNEDMLTIPMIWHDAAIAAGAAVPWNTAANSANAPVGRYDAKTNAAALPVQFATSVPSYVANTIFYGHTLLTKFAYMGQINELIGSPIEAIAANRAAKTPGDITGLFVTAGAGNLTEYFNEAKYIVHAENTEYMYYRTGNGVRTDNGPTQGTIRSAINNVNQIPYEQFFIINNFLESAQISAAVFALMSIDSSKQNLLINFKDRKLDDEKRIESIIKNVQDLVTCDYVNRNGMPTCVESHVYTNQTPYMNNRRIYRMTEDILKNFMIAPIFTSVSTAYTNQYSPRYLLSALLPERKNYHDHKKFLERKLSLGIKKLDFFGTASLDTKEHYANTKVLPRTYARWRAMIKAYWQSFCAQRSLETGDAEEGSLTTIDNQSLFDFKSLIVESKVSDPQNDKYGGADEEGAQDIFAKRAKKELVMFMSNSVVNTTSQIQHEIDTLMCYALNAMCNRILFAVDVYKMFDTDVSKQSVRKFKSSRLILGGSESTKHGGNLLTDGTVAVTSESVNVRTDILEAYAGIIYMFEIIKRAYGYQELAGAESKNSPTAELIDGTTSFTQAQAARNANVSILWIEQNRGNIWDGLVKLLLTRGNAKVLYASELVFADFVSTLNKIADSYGTTVASHKLVSEFIIEMNKRIANMSLYNLMNEVRNSEERDSALLSENRYDTSASYDILNDDYIPQGKSSASINSYSSSVLMTQINSKSLQELLKKRLRSTLETAITSVQNYLSEVDTTQNDFKGHIEGMIRQVGAAPNKFKALQEYLLNGSIGSGNTAVDVFIYDTVVYPLGALLKVIQNMQLNKVYNNPSAVGNAGMMMLTTDATRFTAASSNRYTIRNADIKANEVKSVLDSIVVAGRTGITNPSWANTQLFTPITGGNAREHIRNALGVIAFAYVRGDVDAPATAAPALAQINNVITANNRDSIYKMLDIITAMTAQKTSRLVDVTISGQSITYNPSLAQKYAQKVIDGIKNTLIKTKSAFPEDSAKYTQISNAVAFVEAELNKYFAKKAFTMYMPTKLSDIFGANEPQQREMLQILGRKLFAQMRTADEPSLASIVNTAITRIILGITKGFYGAPKMHKVLIDQLGQYIIPNDPAKQFVNLLALSNRANSAVYEFVATTNNRATAPINWYTAQYDQQDRSFLSSENAQMLTGFILLNSTSTNKDAIVENLSTMTKESRESLLAILPAYKMMVYRVIMQIDTIMQLVTPYEFTRDAAVAANAATAANGADGALGALAAANRPVTAVNIASNAAETDAATYKIRLLACAAKLRKLAQSAYTVIDTLLNELAPNIKYLEPLDKMSSVFGSQQDALTPLSASLMISDETYVDGLMTTAASLDRSYASIVVPLFHNKVSSANDLFTIAPGLERMLTAYNSAVKSSATLSKEAIGDYLKSVWDLTTILNYQAVAFGPGFNKFDSNNADGLKYYTPDATIQPIVDETLPKLVEVLGAAAGNAIVGTIYNNINQHLARLQTNVLFGKQMYTKSITDFKTLMQYDIAQRGIQNLDDDYKSALRYVKYTGIFPLNLNFMMSMVPFTHIVINGKIYEQFMERRKREAGLLDSVRNKSLLPEHNDIIGEFPAAAAPAVAPALPTTNVQKLLHKNGMGAPYDRATLRDAQQLYRNHLRLGRRANVFFNLLQQMEESQVVITKSVREIMKQYSKMPVITARDYIAVTDNADDIDIDY